MAKLKPVIVFAQQDWNSIEALVEHTVVQVCAESRDFNWAEPYVPGQQAESRSSGFFVDGDGHIITVAHGIEHARLIWIKMPALGAKLLFADVVGMCPDRDTALLKLRPESIEYVRKAFGSIPYLMMGNSDAVNHTDKVLVLGYPLGQNNIKSSTGVISGRESGVGRTFFQITAPVNPGNSGGPLFNVQGQVIGMTLAMVMTAQNIGYAIPINDIAMVLADLYTKKLVRTGTLGARFNSCDDAQAQFLGNPTPAGLYVNTVLPNSLFENAGVKTGDMIYVFNGFRIDGSGHTSVPWTIDRASIHDLVSRLTPDQKVTMTLFRNGEQKDIEFAFVMQEPYPIRWLYPSYEPVEFEVIGGMVIMHLSDNHINEFVEELPQLCHYLEIENKLKPVLIISHVIPGSYAYQTGSIRRGHIIKEINGKPAATIQELRSLLVLSTKSGFLTLKTTDNTFVVFSFKHLLSDEQRLANDFNYTLSSTMKALIEDLQQDKK